MDRFFNDDQENEKPFFDSGYDDDDDDDDDDDLEAETIAYIQSPDLMQYMQFGLNGNHLLDKAVEIASQNWFWKFKSAESKLSDIALIYHNLQIITEPPEEVEDPQEPPKES